MAQLVEHVLGKDEVPGPNPGSSSKKREQVIDLLSFFNEIRLAASEIWLRQVK